MKTLFHANEVYLLQLYSYNIITVHTNVVVRNCTICHKLILSDRANVAEICGSEKCKREQHRLQTIAARKKNKANPIQDFYDVFTHNCANLRRKLNKNSTAREKFDIEFKAARTQALAMKNGLSEDSPKQSIYEYSEFLRVGEERLRDLAEKLMLTI